MKSLMGSVVVWLQQQSLHNVTEKSCRALTLDPGKKTTVLKGAVLVKEERGSRKDYTTSRLHGK